MLNQMKERLAIKEKDLKEINNYLLSDNNFLVKELLDLIAKYGGVNIINERAMNASNLTNQIKKLKELDSPYLKDINWLMEQREKHAFISLADYALDCDSNCYKCENDYSNTNAVTLEISALQYFPWLITQAKRAIKNRELMPGRFIRVRNMKEQEADNGDIIAISAAMNILGTTWVETLDTRGTDGANVHLGGPETIAGYFGGPGQPNNYALKWVDEFLYYYTNYGVSQVLNLNPGTVLLSYFMYRLGIDNKFKISVFMGNDNPYSVMWTLMTAKLFAREDGSTPLAGFNFSNSVNEETIELSNQVRKSFGFEEHVRFEHHITETYKSIVRQPYDKTEELVSVASYIKNISAKHEGGIPSVEEKMEHPSDILDYFMTKEQVLEENLMEKLEKNYLEKHIALNKTAALLLKNNIPVFAAPGIHSFK